MSDGRSLETLRGEFPAVTMSARRIALSIEAPACTRRKALDAAEVDTTKLAALLTGRSEKQSIYQMQQQRQFERIVTEGADGMSTVIALARKYLHIPEEFVGVIDLSEAALRASGGSVTPDIRELRTRQALARLLRGADDGIELIRSPLLPLRLAGRIARVEPDVVALAAEGRIHVIEIRSFSIKDGVPDPDLLAQTTMQAAVTVAALREVAAGMGFEHTQVSADVLLVLPTNLTLVPTAVMISAENALIRLRRGLELNGDIADALDELDRVVSLPAMPTKKWTAEEKEHARVQAADAVSALPFRFRDSCVSCPLFSVCRSDVIAADSLSRMGSGMVGAMGPITTTREAWSLIDGDSFPGDSRAAAVIDELQLAQRIVQRAQAASA